MKSFLAKIARPLLGRIVSGALVAGSGYLATAFGIQLSDATVHELTVAGVGLIMYAVTHKTIGEGRPSDSDPSPSSMDPPSASPFVIPMSKRVS